MSFIWLYKNSLAAQLKLIVHFCKGGGSNTPASAVIYEGLINANISTRYSWIAAVRQNFNDLPA